MSTRSVVAAVLALAVGSAAAMPLGVRSVMHGRAAVMQISAAGTESAAVSVSAGGEASVAEPEVAAQMKSRSARAVATW